MTFQQRKRLDEAFDKLSVGRRGVQCKKADILDRCDGPLLRLADQIQVMLTTQEDGEPMVGKADWQHWADALVKQYEPSMVDQVIAAFDIEPVGHVDGVRLVHSDRPDWDEEEMQLVQCFDAFDANHDGILEGKEVVAMRDRDSQKFLTKHGLITQETAELVKTKKKTGQPFTRKQFLTFVAQLGPEYDDEVGLLISDLQGQITFVRGELSAEELLNIGSSFGRLCPKDYHRSSKLCQSILLSLWDQNEQTEIVGLTVVAKYRAENLPSKSGGDGNQIYQAEGLALTDGSDGNYKVLSQGPPHNGVVLEKLNPRDLTIYISWEDLMILARKAKTHDPEEFQRRLERMSRRSQGSVAGDEESNASNPDAMVSVRAPNSTRDMPAGTVLNSDLPQRGTCRANCSPGCVVM